ncbi:MAG: LPS export ABC transporter permease LptG [Smithellaceae bacterium]
MKILDKYILKDFLKYFAIIFFSFIALYLIVDFFSKIRMFLSNDATMAQMVAYFLYSIPMIVSMILPAVILLTTLITYSSLSKFSEITAMKANGISLYRIALPALSVAVISSAFLFYFSEFVAPASFHKTEQIVKVDIQKFYSKVFFKNNAIWFRSDDAIYNFKMFNVDDNSMRGVTIYYLNPDFTLAKRVDAKQAQWKDGKWLLHNWMTASFVESKIPVLEWGDVKNADIPEKPDDFKAIQLDVEKMGYFDLKEYVKKIAAEGYDTTKYQVVLAGKIAFPWVMVIMIFIGMSFSFRSERGGGIMQSLAVGIVIGFSYWIVHAVFMASAQSGTIPPVIAAWSANVIFSAAAA